MGKWSWDASDKFDRLEIQQKNVAKNNFRLKIPVLANCHWKTEKTISAVVHFLKFAPLFLFCTRVWEEIRQKKVCLSS